MKKLGIILPVFIFFICGAAVFSAEITSDDIRKEIDKHFAQSQGPIKFITEITADSTLSKIGNKFFTENFLHIDYLTKHDTDYIESVIELFSLYLKAGGEQISDFTEKPRKEFTVFDMKSAGIRFIFPFRVAEDGKIATMICVTGLAFQDYVKRDIKFEAFIFDAIFNEIKNKDISLLVKVKKYGKLIRELNLSTNDDDLLKRAQGFMWAQFYSDKDFARMLIESYQKKADYLPFKIMIE